MNHQRIFAVAVLICLQVFSVGAIACELVKKYGVYKLDGDNCFSVQRQYTIKSPNIVASGAGVSYISAPGFSISVSLVNTGDLDTGEYVFPIFLFSGNSSGTNDGTFDVSVSINVRDMSGRPVLFYNESNGAHIYSSQWTFRVDELRAHEFRHYSLSSNQFSLPDSDNHYDVCMTVWADPIHNGSIRGEIVETDESDNVFSGFSRLPGQSVPPNFEPGFCHSPTGEEISQL